MEDKIQEALMRTQEFMLRHGRVTPRKKHATVPRWDKVPYWLRNYRHRQFRRQSKIALDSALLSDIDEIILPVRPLQDLP